MDMLDGRQCRDLVMGDMVVQGTSIGTYVGRHSVGAIWLGIRTLGGSGIGALCGAHALSFLGYARTDPQPDTSQIQAF